MSRDEVQEVEPSSVLKKGSNRRGIIVVNVFVLDSLAPTVDSDDIEDE